MRAVFEKRPVPPGQSFRFFQHRNPAFSFHWHFQADYELVLITRGRGQRFIGDHVGSFQSGDLVLVGPHLPHTWVSEPGRNPGGCATIYLQFDRECFGEQFFELAELSAVRRLLALSLRGVAFSGKARVQAATWIKRLPQETGFRRVLCLLHALEALSRARDPQLLASPRYASVPHRAAGERLKRVYAFIGQRYREPFSLAEIAAHAHLAPSAFSRFFRRAAGTTLTEYLNELRVGYACARLCGSDETIASIAYESGFESLPYFNRRFRALKGMSPGVFRRQFLH